MRLRGNYLVSGFFLLTGLYGIIVSSGFRYWESMTLPLITSSLVFILAAVQLIRDLLKNKKSPSDIQEKDKIKNKKEIKKGLIIFGWASAFVLVTYLFGFYISIPAFSITYLKLQSRGWITSIIFAAVFLLFVFLIFELVLKTPLYRGLFFRLFM